MKRKKVITYIALSLVIGAVIAAVLIYNANKILKYELGKFLGKGFAVENIELGWGNVKAKKIRLLRPSSQSYLLQTDRTPELL